MFTPKKQNVKHNFGAQVIFSPPFIPWGPKLFVAEIAPSHKKTVNLIDFPVPNPTKIVIGGDKTLGPRVVRSKRIAPFYYFPCGVTVTDSTRIVNGGDGGAGTASSA